jgi:hypothetical protein
MFEKQGQHYLSLAILLAGVYFLATGYALSGQLWGIRTQTWLWISVAVPIAHQVCVWLFWRLELHHGLIKQWFGDSTFTIYRIGFTILFAARPVAQILLGISNQNTLSLNPYIAYTLAVVFFLLFIYTMYSVAKYFGMDRAYGIDHFDPSYRTKPFVKQGMFKYTNNAMYKFGFLIFWAIALAFLSKAALISAAFSHLYIWVHFYFTELPDIKHIYGDPSKEPV